MNFLCLAKGLWQLKGVILISTSAMGANYRHYRNVFSWLQLVDLVYSDRPALELYCAQPQWWDRQTNTFSLNICWMVISWTLSLSPLFLLLERVSVLLLDAHLHMNINQRYLSGGLHCFIGKLKKRSVYVQKHRRCPVTMWVSKLYLVLWRKHWFAFCPYLGWYDVYSTSIPFSNCTV